MHRILLAFFGLILSAHATADGTNDLNQGPVPANPEDPGTAFNISDCSGIDPAEEYPFPQDCLQQVWLTSCTETGTMYPADVANSTDFYQTMTWIQYTTFVTDLRAAADADNSSPAFAECRGITDSPTPNPTNLPTTAGPSPAPSRIPTALTPSPTWAEDSEWVPLYSNDGTTPILKTELKELCDALYNKQYDLTEYLFRVKTNEPSSWDYYRPGADNELCDVLIFRDEDGNQLYPMRCRDEFDHCWQTTLENWDGTNRLDDARLQPYIWIDGYDNPASDPSGNSGGFATTGTGAAAWGQEIYIDVTSRRTHRTCRDRISPWDDETIYCKDENGDHPRFDRNARGYSCDPGERPQGNLIVEDDWALWYAMANQAYIDCNALCIWDIRPFGETQLYPNFWIYDADGPSDTAGTGCWNYGAEDGSKDYRVTNVDKYANAPEGEGGTESSTKHGCRASYNLAEASRGDQWDHYEAWIYWQEQIEDFCPELCDFTNDWRYQPANDMCTFKSSLASWSSSNSTCIDAGANLASIASWEENEEILAHCLKDNTATIKHCWIGGPIDKGSADATWPDGTPIEWVNFEVSEHVSGSNETGYDVLYMDEQGYWSYADRTAIDEKPAICEMPAMVSAELRYKTAAEACRDSRGFNNDNLQPATPVVQVVESGFTDVDNPDVLEIIVDVPKLLYDIEISFEGSTNDVAEFSRMYQASDMLWDVDEAYDNGNGVGCDGVYRIASHIRWQDFNLGGAGGVTRLETYMDSTGGLIDTYETDDAGAINKWYMFASTIRVAAKQPMWVRMNNTNHATGVDILREEFFVSDVIIRAPMIFKFQKSVIAQTQFDIVSTKFNYKTVAAIIESIQLNTRYEQPPYAEFELKLRTKTQYPYLFMECNGTETTGYDLTPMWECDTMHVTYPETLQDPAETNVLLFLYWVSSDIGCTFIDPDHSREGDVCTQEWRLRIVPENNKCYATGDYHIEFDAECFHGKEVCYMPRDENDDYINTVTFTFKLQTSKICPQLVDEVQLQGFLECTGRESFKPALENRAGNFVEDATPGDAYLQGETIKFIANVISEKARITATRVRIVEVTQDLTTLLQTGINRVPYDPKQSYMVIWTRANEFGQIEDGAFTLTMTDGTVVSDVYVMDDDKVYDSGDVIYDGGTPDTLIKFNDTECGFEMLLHSKAFPINRQSFGVKSVIVTMEVEYQALSDLAGFGDGDTSGRRRRLQTASSPLGDQSITAANTVQVRSFEADQMKVCTNGACGLKLQISMASRANNDRDAARLAAAMEDAVYRAFIGEISSPVDPSQVSVDFIEVFHDDGTGVWRPKKFWASAQYANAPVSEDTRRDNGIPDFSTFIFHVSVASKEGDFATAQDLRANFVDQVSRPASILMNQDLILNAQFHKIEGKDVRGGKISPTDKNDKTVIKNERENGASQLSPILPASLVIIVASCILGLW